MVKDGSEFSPRPAVTSSVTLDELLNFSVVISSFLSRDNIHSSQDHKTRQQGAGEMTHCVTPLPHKHGRWGGAEFKSPHQGGGHGGKHL